MLPRRALRQVRGVSSTACWGLKGYNFATLLVRLHLKLHGLTGRCTMMPAAPKELSPAERYEELRKFYRSTAMMQLFYILVRTAWHFGLPYIFRGVVWSCPAGWHTVPRRACWL